jgi:hypothetical protein
MARLTVVGSSDAFNAAGRCHSCYLLEGDGAGPLMIDFGATALYALRKIGRSAAEVRGFASPMRRPASTSRLPTTA